MAATQEKATIQSQQQQNGIHVPLTRFTKDYAGITFTSQSIHRVWDQNPQTDNPAIRVHVHRNGRRHIDVYPHDPHAGEIAEWAKEMAPYRKPTVSLRRVLKDHAHLHDNKSIETLSGWVAETLYPLGMARPVKIRGSIKYRLVNQPQAIEMFLGHIETAAAESVIERYKRGEISRAALLNSTSRLLDFLEANGIKGIGRRNVRFFAMRIVDNPAFIRVEDTYNNKGVKVAANQVDVDLLSLAATDILAAARAYVSDPQRSKDPKVAEAFFIREGVPSTAVPQLLEEFRVAVSDSPPSYLTHRDSMRAFCSKARRGVLAQYQRRTDNVQPADKKAQGDSPKKVTVRHSKRAEDTSHLSIPLEEKPVEKAQTAQTPEPTKEKEPEAKKPERLIPSALDLKPEDRVKNAAGEEGIVIGEEVIGEILYVIVQFGRVTNKVRKELTGLKFEIISSKI